MTLKNKLCIRGNASLSNLLLALPSILWLVITITTVNVCVCDPIPESSKVYHNQFAVLIPKGPKTADQVAAAHGFVNLGQVSINC